MANNDPATFLFNALKAKKLISSDRLDFFRDIVLLQHRIKKKLHKAHPPLNLSDEFISKHIRKGCPLISGNNLPLDERILDELLQDLLTIVQQHDSSTGEEIANIGFAHRNGDINPAVLVGRLLAQDSRYFKFLSKAIGVRWDLLVYMSLSLAKPFLEHLSSLFNDKIDDSFWLKNSCPVCGSLAHIARLDKEDGKRLLYCQLCSGKWHFARIKCAFCCNADAKNLKIMEETEGPYRVDLCDQCGRYIKTFVERKAIDVSEEFIPLMEDLATTYLDILAEQEGYERSFFSPPEAEPCQVPGDSEFFH